MRKLIVGLSIVCAAFMATHVALAATAKQAPEMIKIDDCAAKQPAVNFPHAKHMKLAADCKTCHHTQADLKAGTDMEVKACKTCHVAPEKADMPKCAEMSMTKNPFHMVCLTCHKAEVAKDATKKAPTKCADCHVKA